MTFNQLIKLLPKVVKYNLKIIFAGKFFLVSVSGILDSFAFFYVSECVEPGKKINEGLYL